MMGFGILFVGNNGCAGELSCHLCKALFSQLLKEPLQSLLHKSAKAASLVSQLKFNDLVIVITYEHFAWLIA